VTLLKRVHEGREKEWMYEEGGGRVPSPFISEVGVLSVRKPTNFKPALKGALLSKGWEHCAVFLSRQSLAM